MGKPKSPTPPDPVETARAQTGTNVSTAVANTAMSNVNRVGPDGTVTFDQTGTHEFTDPTTGETFEVPTYTQTTKLDATGRRLDRINDDTQISLARTGRRVSDDIGKLLRDPVDLSDAQKVRVGNRERKRVEDALMQRMNPQIEQDREALEARLAGQGIALGSAAYDRAQENFGRNVNDARLGAIINAGAESDRAFNQSLAARQQDVSEEFAQRGQSINEVTALMSGSQVNAPNTPAPNVAGIPTTDYAGLVNSNYNAQMKGYQGQLASRNAMMGGLFDIASAGVTVI
ncbi:MAG: hypothetical protein AAF762_00235 [Pseudomonadota bacterium]